MSKMQINTSDRAQSLWDNHGAWSNVTFGDGGPLGSLRHLEKEAREAQAEVGMDTCKLVEEIADCFLLTIDSARRAGLSLDLLLDACFVKLEINKNRKWGPKIKDQPVEHVKEVENG